MNLEKRSRFGQTFRLINLQIPIPNRSPVFHPELPELFLFHRVY